MWAIKQSTSFIGQTDTTLVLYSTRDAARNWINKLKADRPHMVLAPMTFVKVNLTEVTDANKG
jgi:hypothetical protein